MDLTICCVPNVCSLRCGGRSSRPGPLEALRLGTLTRHHAAKGLVETDEVHFVSPRRNGSLLLRYLQ